MFEFNKPNIEIAENIGNDHLFIFGRDVHEVEKIREEIKRGKRGLC